MGTVSFRCIRIHSDGYCSQARTPPSPVRTIEEGVRIIEEILRKKLLCRHDVQDINNIYRAIDFLEGQVTVIPRECNSQTVLEKIIERIQRKYADIQAEDLISLYHLRNFSCEELPIDRYFNDLSRWFGRSPEKVKKIAALLPCCLSEEQFNQDAAALIGQGRDIKAAKTLDRKKAKLQQYECTKKAIQERKLVLNRLREREPLKYPAYFDELLNNGYICLYDHLMQMRECPTRHERRAIIEQMTFSNLAHVILETREAIIQKVESSIPAESQNVLFLLGSSGAGKSTTFCFFRGDKMVLNGSNYESTNDKNGLIGHEGATSCTFLPAIEVTQDWVIVDFPGFEDTNEQLVSMGVELALKALAQKYSPKLLVLEAITNTEGRFANAAKLGQRLSRLLGDKKENCILGITKYSKDADFERVRAIEAQQKKERLDQTREETQLIAKIEVYSSLRQPGSEPSLQEQEMQRKLEGIQRKREEEARQPLPDTPEKVQSRKRFQEREHELLKQIGLRKEIHFCHLEDAGRLSSCLASLSQPLVKEPSRNQLPVQVVPSHRLDPEDERLLEERFKKNLMQVMETKQDYDIDFENFKAFEQSVLESSLISTVFSHSNPEIGQFLHLPEMDLNIVRKYDVEIVDKCVNECIKFVIRTLNIALIDRILDEKGALIPREKADSLRKIKNAVRDHVLGLLGELPEDRRLADIRWAELQIDQTNASLQVEAEYRLPTWANLVLHIPLLIPIAIYNLVKNNAQSKAQLEVIVKEIENSCIQLQRIYDILLRLNDIRKTIKKREEIIEIFNSANISLESVDGLHNSIKKRINKVRAIYGNEEWDKRVAHLADGIPLLEYLKQNNAYLVYLIAAAYTLIEPGLCYQIRAKSIENIPPLFENLRKIAVFIEKPEGRAALLNSTLEITVNKPLYFENYSYRELKETAEFLLRKDQAVHNDNPEIELFAPGIRVKAYSIGSLVDLSKYIDNILKKFVSNTDPLSRALSAAAVLRVHSILNSSNSEILD